MHAVLLVLSVGSNPQPFDWERLPCSSLTVVENVQRNSGWRRRGGREASYKGSPPSVHMSSDQRRAQLGVLCDKT